MSDTHDTRGEAPKRPNANYKLSKEHADPAELVYHYNRERRLAKASPAVQNLYRKEPPKRFSLLRPLIGSGPRAMMFASIVVSCVLILVVSNLGLAGDTRDLDGNRLSVEAIRYEGTVIIALKKSPQNTFLSRFMTPYTGAVGIAVTPALKPDTEQLLSPEDIFYHKIFFTLDPIEYYRFAIPFDSAELTLVFQTEKKTLGITVRPE